MNKREAAVLTAYTGVLMGELSDFQEYVESILESPIFTNELANKGLWDKIKEKAKPDFLAIMKNLEETNVKTSL